MSRQCQAKGIATQIYGFDISDGQFPNAALLPDNVSLKQHDAFKPFGEDLIGQFDLVYIRAFVSIVSPDNIDAFLSNIKTLLSKSDC